MKKKSGLRGENSRTAVIDMLEKDQSMTVFQKRVYKAVLEIPCGQTRSYKWVAGRIGKPHAARAVGNALNRNPHTIVIPCHRVIRSDNSIGGYSRGQKMKADLIRKERTEHVSAKQAG